MTRAPLVMGKASEPFQRTAEIHDTTIGWRFVNPILKLNTASTRCPRPRENVAEEFQIPREDQDRFALRSQTRAAAAQKNGRFAEEIVPVTIRQRKGETVVERDEHPRRDEPRQARLAQHPIPRRFRDHGQRLQG